MTPLDAALTTVLESCLRVMPGERVLVLTDPRKRGIADSFVRLARELGTEAVLVEMAERETHGTEPPDFVVPAMLACDVLIAPASKSVSHTEARRAACENGVRAATLPDVTEEMLIRTMSADYGEIRRRSHALARLLTDGCEARLTSARGTDVAFVLEDRSGISDDGDLSSAGAFGNLPAGEGFISPAEGSTRGRIVFDGSIWPLGLLDSPLTVDIEDGYAMRFGGVRGEEFRTFLEPKGRQAFAVAELGVGANDAAKVTGNILEDEKVMGTVHVALGDNHTFGGRIRVGSHQDGVILEPTLSIDSHVVVDQGRLLV